MSTEVLLNEFKEYSEHPYRVLSEYKKQGKKAVSYTHLDVYKRQRPYIPNLL